MCSVPDHMWSSVCVSVSVTGGVLVTCDSGRFSMGLPIVGSVLLFCCQHYYHFSVQVYSQLCHGLQSCVASGSVSSS